MQSGSARVLLVLGMHRSGTSAVAGMLADAGLDAGTRLFGGTVANQRGNRENPRLTRLHERILTGSGGSWHEPPGEVRIRGRHRRRRDEILAEYQSDGTIVVKDPRLLLVLELWRELEPLRVGVLRNPASVVRSLQARGRQVAGASDAALLELWKTYNRALAAELESGEVPLVVFDDAEQLGDQVAAALRRHGLATPDSFDFFEPGIVRNQDRDWRGRVDAEAIELYERIAAHRGS